MSKPPSNMGRLLDDDMPQGYGSNGGARPRPTVVPSEPFAAAPDPERPRIASPSPAAMPAVPLQPAQRACYEALGLALQEGHVFAAMTGPESSGKSTVLEAVLADRHDRALRCIRISDPDKVPARLAAQIEQVAYAEAGKPENLERHVVLAIDDAHTASNELLRCLARLAAMREPGRRVPQVLLVGRPELWSRLATEEYAPLARRLAVRAVLPTLKDEQDPWASLEQEVSQTMSRLRAEHEHLPVNTAAPNMPPMFDRAYGDFYPTTVEEAGLPFDPSTVPPPTDFALFPEPSPRMEPKRRESTRRLLMPLGCLMAGVAGFTFVLSYFDWPGLFDDMPWADSKPAASFAFAPRNNQPGMPGVPNWAQPTQRTAQMTPPRGAPLPPVIAPPSVSAAPPAPTAALSTMTPAPSSPAAPSPAPAENSPPRSSVATSEPAASAPKPAEPAPTVAAAPVEPPKVEDAKPTKIAEAAVKPPEPTKPVATQSSEPAHVTAPTVQASTAAPVASKPVTPPPAEPTMTVAALAAPPLSATSSRSTRAAPIAVVKPAPLPPAIVGLMLRRGNEQLAMGDVSAARILFERAAESGNAQGAFRLGRTYDALFLPPADASTLANRSEARVWYTRAASLGDRDAAARLRDLNEGR